MIRKLLVAAAIAATAFAGTANAQTKELNFGIISTESQQNLKSKWEPFLADMETQTGYKVKAFFAPDYAGVIEGMRFDKVQIAWYGNKAAMEAIDRAGGEIFVQSVSVTGDPGYWSHLIVHKDSPLNSMQDVLKNASNLTFGNGDPNSTSGFLVPSYYVFSQNKINDPKQVFKRVVAANHETNALAVINKQVDVATNNSENLALIKQRFPDKFGDIKVIWTSPLIPSDPIVWRKEMAAEDKTKLKSFFLTYGTKSGSKSDAQVQQELKILTALQWAPFRASDNNQLLPIRQLEMFKDRNKIAGDEKLSADERNKKLSEIDAELAKLEQQVAMLKK